MANKLPLFTVRFRNVADYETLGLIIERFYIQNKSDADYSVAKQVMETIKVQNILLKQVYFNLEFAKGLGIGYDPITEEIRGELLFPSPLEDYQKILTISVYIHHEFWGSMKKRLSQKYFYHVT